MKRREFIKKVGVGAAAVGAGAAATASLTGCGKQDDSAEVAKLKKEVADLKAKGVSFIQEPDTQPWGTLAIIQDSEGNHLLVVEQPKE